MTPTYSQRIARRMELWWGPPKPGGRGLGDAVHRLRERRIHHDRDQPDPEWRCCGRWQRNLLNKWNSREFAARHGCRVPELYWYGSDPRAAPIESLPEHFVIRPERGAARRGVHLVSGGRELLTDEPAFPEQLRERLPRAGAVRRPVRHLFEEFARSEDGGYRIPVGYKWHCFGGEIAAGYAVESVGPDEWRQRHYTPDWEPIDDPMSTFLPQADPRDPPGCLQEMLDLTQLLGAELGTYMRIDFFATDRGCMFNEFSSVPLNGGHNTPYCDELFGAFWAEHVPNAS